MALSEIEGLSVYPEQVTACVPGSRRIDFLTMETETIHSRTGAKGRRGFLSGFPLLLLLLGFTFCPAASRTVAALEKITMGEVEDVILLPWGVKLPARVDTGAALTSLDAQELKVVGKEIQFRLPKQYGNLLLRVPLKGWREIRNAENREKRPLVELTFCVGPRKIRAEVTLNDRSTVKYPVVVGRNILKDQFVVDCTHSNCLPPSCPESAPQ
jgi:hypothetical protein